MISHVESGHSALLMDGAVKAAHKLGVSLDNLVGMTFDPTTSAELTIEGIIPEIRQLPGVRPVPVRRLRTVAGSGALDLDEEVEAYAYFRNEWLSRQRLVSERCCSSVTGESMEPTLPECGVILFDRGGHVAGSRMGSPEIRSHASAAIREIIPTRRAIRMPSPTTHDECKRRNGLMRLSWNEIRVLAAPFAEKR